MEEAGAAIAKWFAGLSGAALDAAILKAFDHFDTDKTGLLDRCRACVPSCDRIHIHVFCNSTCVPCTDMTVR